MNLLAQAGRTPAGVDGWSRRRLLTVVACVLAAATALLAGLGYAVYLSFAPSPDTTATTGPGRSSPGQDLAQARRDRIAAAPMLAVTPQDALPGPPSTDTAPGIVIPPATGNGSGTATGTETGTETGAGGGAGGVPTGYPRTPEGAVGQLAAIETTVFQAMSMPLTAEVYRHWTMPQPAASGSGSGLGSGSGSGSGERDVAERSGRPVVDAGRGTGVAGWQIARHVQSFLGAAQMGPEKDITTTVTATPVAGLVKGTDGPDWVLACVLLEVRAVISTEARIGYGHCERMQWHDGRWLIAAGAAPARAPSTWPGSQRSIDAGWQTWVDTATLTKTATVTDTSGAPAGPVREP